MNKHDQERKEALINALCKSKEKAETFRLYLTANNRDPDDIAAANLAIGHIEIAIEHLNTSNT